MPVARASETNKGWYSRYWLLPRSAGEEGWASSNFGPEGIKEMWTYRFKMLKHSCSFWTQRPVNSNRSQRCVRSLAIYAHHSQAYIWGNPHTFRPVTANQHLHLVLQSSPPREGRPLRSLSGRSSFDRSADVTQSSSGLLSEFSGISK